MHLYYHHGFYIKSHMFQNYFKINFKAFKNTHTSLLNNTRLLYSHYNTRNRWAIIYHSKLIEFMDGAKIFEYPCCNFTKQHWACDKWSQMITHMRRTRRDANRHGRRRYIIKISADASYPDKSKIKFHLTQFRDYTYFCNLCD